MDKDNLKNLELPSLEDIIDGVANLPENQEYSLRKQLAYLLDREKLIDLDK